MSDWWGGLLLPRLNDEIFKSWPQVVVERYFQINERGTTISREVRGGVVHFCCTAFILAVNPTLLSYAGVDGRKTAVATALSTGFSSALCGLATNLPFILAPTTATSLYYGLVIQNANVSYSCGNSAVLLLGLLLIASSLNSLSRVLSALIPFNIKVGAILGIALLVSLEALCQLKVVQAGTRTVLTAGEFTSDVYIAFLAFVFIAICLHYKLKGAFFLGILVAATLFCMADTGHARSWPPAQILAQPTDFPEAVEISGFTNRLTYKLIFDLFVISVILVDGLGTGLVETALADESGNDDAKAVKPVLSSASSFQWLYISIGMGSVLSALLSSGPILLSPESAAGIRAGSRTGLSAVVCGCLFLLTIPFTPLLATLPAAATSPVLLMIALMLFESSSKIRWSSIKEGTVVFTMICVIPFTYSVFNGVALGLTVFAIMAIATDLPLYIKKARKVSRVLWKALGLDKLNTSAASSSLRDDLMVNDRADVEYSGVVGGARDGDGEEDDSEGESGSGGSSSDEEDRRTKILSFQLNEIGSAKKKLFRSSTLGPLPLGASPGASTAEDPASPALNSFDEYRKQRKIQRKRG